MPQPASEFAVFDNTHQSRSHPARPWCDGSRTVALKGESSRWISDSLAASSRRILSDRPLPTQMSHRAPLSYAPTSSEPTEDPLAREPGTDQRAVQLHYQARRRYSDSRSMFIATGSYPTVRVTCGLTLSIASGMDRSPGA